MIYLNEVYFGKSHIAPLQELFSSVRKKAANKPFSMAINTDKDILKFNRIAEQIFGFDTFALVISPDYEVNAGAIPIGLYRSKDQQKKYAAALRASNGGFRFDPSYGQISASCYINLGMLNQERVTDEEIMAVLLHEIGHMFFEVVTDKECVYTSLFQVTEILKSINKKITERISNGKDASAVDINNDVKSSIIGRFMNTKFFNIRFIKHKSFVKRLFKHESMGDNMTKSMVDYTGEKFADSFAASYGYGAELHSFLMKSNDIYDKFYKVKESKNPLVVSIATMFLLKNDLNEYIDGVKDEHPEALARVKVTADYLKRELSKQGLDPKLKIQLLNQIEQINKLLDDYINFPKDEDSIKISRTYYTILYNEFGGDRREQDADNDALFNTIDKRYNDLMK